MSDSKQDESIAQSAQAESSEQIQQDRVPQQASPEKLPGSELVALREKFGMSVEQMAARLKLTPRQILALEADNYAALPGKAIVRGFIRAYAKALNVDPAPLVAMVPADKPSQMQTPAPAAHGMAASYSETRMPTLGNRNPASSKWVAAVVAIIVLIGVLMVGRQNGWLPNLSKQELRQAEKTAASSDASAASGATSVSGVAGAEGEAGKLVQKDLPPIASAQVLPAVDAASQQQAAKPADAASSEAANAAAAASPVNALVLKCREQSWYEIRRANGNVVKSGLLQAGASETFEVVEPVQLTLGNAAGVDATLRGAPLEIRTEVGSRVVKLNLK